MQDAALGEYVTAWPVWGDKRSMGKIQGIIVAIGEKTITVKTPKQGSFTCDPQVGAIKKDSIFPPARMFVDQEREELGLEAVIWD